MCLIERRRRNIPNTALFVAACSPNFGENCLDTSSRVVCCHVVFSVTRLITKSRAETFPEVTCPASLSFRLYDYTSTSFMWGSYIGTWSMMVHSIDKSTSSGNAEPYLRRKSKRQAPERRDVKKLYRALMYYRCLLYTSPSPRDLSTSRMPSSA